MPPSKQTLRRRALRLLQDEAHPLFVFSLTGEELLQIADAAAHARARVPTELREPLARIQRSAEEAARAWSGSNIGYKATVYYRGLSPKPADSEFSPE